jgi:hypothetical protein
MPLLLENAVSFRFSEIDKYSFSSLSLEVLLTFRLLQTHEFGLIRSFTLASFNIVSVIPTTGYESGHIKLVNPEIRKLVQA